MAIAIQTAQPSTHAAMTTPARTSIGSLLLAAALCLPSLAPAALGEDHGSIETDRRMLHANARQVDAGAYVVTELDDDLGIKIRQYESTTGVVFAVTWQGPFKPDLRQLLGRHFSAYNATPRGRSAFHGRSSIVVVPGGAVIQSEGRPRSFSGIAYLPGLVPVGVVVADLK